MKRLLIFVLFIQLFSFYSFAEETIVQNAEKSSLILIGEVEKVEKWKNREDWQIVTLKPIQILKGSSSLSLIKLLNQKLFPNSPALFSPSKKVLIFLKELPSYTAWQELIQQGIRFEPVGESTAIFEKAEDQKNLVSFVSQFQNLLNSKADPTRLKFFFIETLEKSNSKILQESLVYHLFSQDLSLNSEDLVRLSKLVLNSQISNEAKIRLTKGFVRIKTDESNSILKSFFCLSPDPVCLIAAQELESRKLPIPISEYSKAIEKGSDSLKVGLLQILGRHQRKEAYPLFEKILPKLKDAHQAAEAIEALGEMGGTQAEELSLRYAKDPRYYVRLGVLKSLGTLKSVKGIPILENALKEGDPSMIMISAKSLEKIGTPEALRTIQKYYEKTPHGFFEPAAPEHFNLPK